jgi:hypothetical protein
MKYFFGFLFCCLLVGVVHAIDTEPPASITDLTYNNATCNQVIFEWTNPADEDFNGTEYWLNGVKGLTNLTAEDAPWILFGGLVNETAYTFSTRTFDDFGNANATFVNMTVYVPYCPSAAFFTSNVTCQIASPNVSVYFEGDCGDSEIKSDWFPGDGMSFESVDNFTYVYESTGVYEVTHVCTPPPPDDASSYTLSVVIGPEGTVCEGNCTACGNGYCNRDEYPNYLIVGATLGLLLSLIIIRRNEPE